MFRTDRLNGTHLDRTFLFGAGELCFAESAKTAASGLRGLINSCGDLKLSKLDSALNPSLYISFSPKSFDIFGGLALIGLATVRCQDAQRYGLPETFAHW